MCMIDVVKGGELGKERQHHVTKEFQTVVTIPSGHSLIISYLVQFQ